MVHYFFSESCFCLKGQEDNKEKLWFVWGDMIACKPSNKREAYTSNWEFCLCHQTQKMCRVSSLCTIHIQLGVGENCWNIFYTWAAHNFLVIALITPWIILWMPAQCCAHRAGSALIHVKAQASLCWYKSESSIVEVSVGDPNAACPYVTSMSEEIILSPNTYLRVTDENSFFQIEQNVLSFPRNLPSSFVITSDFGFLFCKMFRLRTASKLYAPFVQIRDTSSGHFQLSEIVTRQWFFKEQDTCVACTRKLFMPIVCKDVNRPSTHM